MYNFSGIVYRIWGVSGIMLLLGIICILLEKPWVKEFKFKSYMIGMILVIAAIGSGVFFAFRIVSPDISSYTGEFIRSNRDSTVAPPLPLTNEYVFWNGEGKKQGFYLDVLSKKEIFPYDFEEGQEYIIYFDKGTKVIVKVDAIEPSTKGIISDEKDN